MDAPSAAACAGGPLGPVTESIPSLLPHLALSILTSQQKTIFTPIQLSRSQWLNHKEKKKRNLPLITRIFSCQTLSSHLVPSCLISSHLISSHSHPSRARLNYLTLVAARRHKRPTDMRFASPPQVLTPPQGTQVSRHSPNSLQRVPKQPYQ